MRINLYFANVSDLLAVLFLPLKCLCAFCIIVIAVSARGSFWREF